MTLVLPNPSDPHNGGALDATPVYQNQTAIAQAIQSFDASQVQAGTLKAAAFDPSIHPNTLLHDTIGPFVASGCIWSVSSGLVGAMSSGVAYISNNSSGLMFRVSVPSIVSYNFTVNSDTYMDIDYLGNPYYSPVAVSGTAPAITANAIRVGIIRTDGTHIISIFQPPNGPYGMPVPSYVSASETTTSTSYTDLATVGPISVVRVGPLGMMKVEIDAYMYNSAADFIFTSINAAFDNVIGTADRQGPQFKAANTANDQQPAYVRTFTGLNPGITWVELRYRVGSGTGTFAGRALTVTGY